MLGPSTVAVGKSSTVDEKAMPGSARNAHKSRLRVTEEDKAAPYAINGAGR
jgi:hypothetical protein